MAGVDGDLLERCSPARRFCSRQLDERSGTLLTLWQTSLRMLSSWIYLQERLLQNRQLILYCDRKESVRCCQLIPRRVGERVDVKEGREISRLDIRVVARETRLAGEVQSNRPILHKIWKLRDPKGYP